ncbi:MAG: hypothetical protein JWM19_660 [Actinomycetia bacterium]|nr:hypothetical protein [Actinomycetes bacterium]
MPPPPVCGAPSGIGVADEVAEDVGVAGWAGRAEWVAEGEEEAEGETEAEGDGEALRDTLGVAEEEEGATLADVLAGLLGEAGEVRAGALREADELAEPVAPDPLPEEVFALPVDPPICGEGEPLAVPLYRLEDVADTVPEDGEKIAGIDEDGPVQADTDTDMRTVTVAQPAAVSLALLTFMKPPYIPGMQQP